MADRFKKGIEERTNEWIDIHSIAQIVEYKLARYMEKVDVEEHRRLYSFVMNRVERGLHRAVIKLTGNNTAAAKILGINRSTVGQHLKRRL